MFGEGALLNHWFRGSEPGQVHAKFWLVSIFMPIPISYINPVSLASIVITILLMVGMRTSEKHSCVLDHSLVTSCHRQHSP